MKIQKNYSKYSPHLFELKGSPEILSWPPMRSYPEKLTEVNQALQKRTKSPIVKYEVKRIPPAQTRSSWDSARLLVLFLENGQILCKRHNNNKILNLNA